MIKTILIVLKKELLETLRDSRTLLLAVLLPAIAIPLIAVGLGKVEGNISDNEKNKQLRIALIDAPEMAKSQLGKDDKVDLFYNYTIEEAKQAIVMDSLDAAMDFAADFSSNIKDLKQGKLNLHYNSTNAIKRNRITEKTKEIEQLIVARRMQQLEVDSSLLSPMIVEIEDMVSPKEQFGKMIGSILPFLFITFCFVGCMYPAIDLITGEKEKGTIETLLTVPASRFHILIGKIAAISIVGLLSAILTIVGMVASSFLLTYGSEIDTSEHSNLMTGDLISVSAIILIVLMLIPLSIFFAGMLSAMVIRTKSFKESQSVVTPLTFVVMAPAIISMSPGMELNWANVWIPVFNISLAVKEIIAGTISMGHYGAILFSLSLIAFIAAYFSYQSFAKETMVLN